ncbi:MAG: hypothetical protein AAF850_04745 [Pseudomonadota bacterium]
MNKPYATAFFAAATIAAAGCASNAEVRASRSRNPAPCPAAIVLADASRMLDFNSETPSLETVAYTAEIEGVTLGCRYFADKPVIASVEIDLAFGRGPRGGERERTFDYFVAVTRKNREVIEKAVFTEKVAFDRTQLVKRKTVKIDEIVIPRRNENISGANFEVIVGLALTKEQLLFNRSGVSLKFPEL